MYTCNRLKMTNTIGITKNIKKLDELVVTINDINVLFNVFCQV